MFGLSFGKLLVFAAVVAFVWFGWRKLAEVGKALQRRGAPAPPQADPRKPGDQEPIDLVRNPVTGQYEPRKRD